MTAASGNPFWDYSLALYGREGVERACLALQDRLGLDVNLLLFCCWAGNRGRTLSPDEIDRLIAATQTWRAEVVAPLRGARRWLKAHAADQGPAAEALRVEIEGSELSAEAIQQDLMHRTLPLYEGVASPASAAANLRACLAACGCTRGPAESDDLAVLLRASCPQVTRAEALRLLAG